MGKFLLRKEIKRLTHAPQLGDKPFVMVTGLARAGTTALTELLYDKQHFHAITYAHMPFLLAPKLWRRLHTPKQTAKRERPHGDKVFVNEHSIEALEEYFFKVMLADSYLHPRHLSIHPLSPEVGAHYAAYQELFRQQADTLYLAKNNNFMLRYESMRQATDSFRTILLFRAPLDHAQSLLRQHIHFSKRQQEDPFILQYMDWLGHHEFGLHHKYLDVGKEGGEEGYDPQSLTYWLNSWVQYYGYVLRVRETHDDLCLVHYADLLQHPLPLKKALAQYLGMAFTLEPIRPFVPPTYPEQAQTQIPIALHTKAQSIYESLLTQKLEWE